MQRSIQELTKTLSDDLTAVNGSQERILIASGWPMRVQYANDPDSLAERIQEAQASEARERATNAEFKRILLNTPDSHKVIKHILGKPEHELNSDELLILAERNKEPLQQAEILLNVRYALNVFKDEDLQKPMCEMHPQELSVIKDAIKDINLQPLILSDNQDIYKLGRVLLYLQGDDKEKSETLRDIAGEASFSSLYQATPSATINSALTTINILENHLRSINSHRTQYLENELKTLLKTDKDEYKTMSALMNEFTTQETHQVQHNMKLREFLLNTPDAILAINRVIAEPIQKLNANELLILKEAVKNIKMEGLTIEPHQKELVNLGAVIKILQGNEPDKSKRIAAVCGDASLVSLYNAAKQSGHTMQSPRPDKSPRRLLSQSGSASPKLSRIASITNLRKLTRASSSSSLSPTESSSPSATGSGSGSGSPSPRGGRLSQLFQPAPATLISVEQLFENSAAALHRNLEKFNPESPGKRRG
jgi:hypothetical protein